MKIITSLTLFVAMTFSLLGQSESPSIQKPYFADFVMGPYLILDGTIYESVFLRGIRIGKEYPSKWGIGIEYIAGNQEDLNGQLGTTHSAFGTVHYYFKENSPEIRFRPYVTAAGGFFEFKDFSADVLGVAFYLGTGIEMNFSPMVKGFLEPRYINLGLMDANGTHQFGVMWGARAKF